MAIRFTDKSPEVPGRKPVPGPARNATTQAEGEARFATPIEAVKPVNPDSRNELPFADLPVAEKAERKKRGVKAAVRT